MESCLIVPFIPLPWCLWKEVSLCFYGLLAFFNLLHLPDTWRKTVSQNFNVILSETKHHFIFTKAVHFFFACFFSRCYWFLGVVYTLRRFAFPNLSVLYLGCFILVEIFYFYVAIFYFYSRTCVTIAIVSSRTFLSKRNSIPFNCHPFNFPFFSPRSG